MKFFAGALLWFISICVYAQKLRIGLFNPAGVQTVVVSVISGTYRLQDDTGFESDLATGQLFYLSFSGQQVQVRLLNGQQSLCNKLVFNAQTEDARFSVRPVSPTQPVRIYDDNLQITPDINRLQLINIVDVEKYIAGVVEAEGGSRAHIEYYKAQAVLCRTYAITNLKRHDSEGFDLCDDVHCQAFKGASNQNIDIITATLQTRHLVLTDKNQVLISALFHSNCGGETANSEMVWFKALPYLRAVKDPYCKSGKNYIWQKRIKMTEWVEYLKRCGFKGVDGVISPAYFNYTQVRRSNYYKLRGDSIAFTQLRLDWKLRSSYFSIEATDNELIIQGRGYGHGVGMCQEGSMQMALLGYDFKKILNYYYTDVQLLDYQQLLPDLQIAGFAK